MSVQRIKKIERITINDPESPTGLTSVGFKTYYTNCIYVYSQIFFHSREIAFIDKKNEKTSVELDRRIEDIDIYHKQFGIPFSQEHNCFFISSWTKGVFCCDKETGKIRWNYKLKHANEVVLYEDYIICAFDGIGLRKLTYEGDEIEKYSITTYSNFHIINDPYVFIGPNRNAYYIFDTSAMEIHSKIKKDTIQSQNESFVILNVVGDVKKLEISGYKDGEIITKSIELQ